MIQFVAPAQLFLVLWLFATTAPAATALVNGSLAALIDAQPIDLQVPNSAKDSGQSIGSSRRIAVDLNAKSDVARVILFALAQDEIIPVSPDRIGTTSFSQETPLALSPSVLHTEVQRHRPRLA
jgi:hypothetical protein